MRHWLFMTMSPMLQRNRAAGPGAPSVLEALREATRSRHAMLSASPAMTRLFDDAYSISEYRTHLGRLLGLFEPLEQAAARAAGPLDLVHTFQRSRALREDLGTLGATPAEIEALERCRRVPRFTPAGLPGYSYVILGSMLGGKIIVKRLRAVLPSRTPFAFYSDGRGRPDALWELFCRGLETSGMNDGAAICAAAVAVFDAYAGWLAEPGEA
jgi:heme oxygenase